MSAEPNTPSAPSINKASRVISDDWDDAPPGTNVKRETADQAAAASIQAPTSKPPGEVNIDEDALPLASRLSVKAARGTGQPRSPMDAGKKAKKVRISDDDLPLSVKLASIKKERAAGGKSRSEQPANIRKQEAAGERGRSERPAKTVEQDDIPLSARLLQLKTKSRHAKVGPASKGAAKKKRPDEPPKAVVQERPKKIVTISDFPDTRGKLEKPKKPAKAKPASDDEGFTEEGDEHKWWEDRSFLEGGVKWASLEHNGVLFPPEYVPHGVPLVYDGKEVELPAEAEEVAGFFAQILETEYAKDEVFVANFFEDFQSLLASRFPSLARVIRRFDLCDFTRMHSYFEDLKESKKSLSKEDKAKIREDKQRLEDKYAYCYLDGRKEKVGNFRVEPPGLFRGRGKHPKTGKVKLRVSPEQITINVGEGAPVPEPPAGHAWGKVIHNNEVAWLACWVENINNSYKYVLFAANSSLKGQSDFRKFEKARELKQHINRIRKTIRQESADEKVPVRQRATALWLIDVLALRAGNEKGEDEADTVGCCSLRTEHVKFEDPNFVVFDFLGKDSIRYYNRVAVDRQIFKNLKIFTKGKGPQDSLFDKLSVTTLNGYLDTLMPGLTAKVFRTHNASSTFQAQLDGTPTDLKTVHEKLLAYNRSNREVAILCNHQRAVPKTHHISIAKLKAKISVARLQRLRIKRELLAANPGAAPREEILAEESDFDEEEATEAEQRLEAEKAEKAAKKKAQHPSEQSPASTQPTTDDEAAEHPKRHSHSYASLGVDKLENALQRLNSRIGALKTQLVDRDENKTTALGTSKINYLDPRISAAWCKRHDVPIEKIFTKALREKFRWAMDVDARWSF